jgi:hypothetical protein
MEMDGWMGFAAFVCLLVEMRVLSSYTRIFIYSEHLLRVWRFSCVLVGGSW